MAHSAVQGRPQKRGTKVDVRIIFLVTEDVNAAIRSAAEEQGESMGTWLRRAVEQQLHLPKNARISSVHAKEQSGAQR